MALHPLLVDRSEPDDMVVEVVVARPAVWSGLTQRDRDFAVTSLAARFTPAEVARALDVTPAVVYNQLAAARRRDQARAVDPALFVCSQCGAGFVPLHGKARYCTEACRRAADNARRVARRGETRDARRCRDCGVPINHRDYRARLCEECSQVSRRSVH